MAEEIWYALVWEDKKLPNEVWYSINPEITKDASAVENANNQTTTGMAWVIYWINAPKIRAKTSIVGASSTLWEVSGSWTFPWGSFSSFTNYSVTIHSPDVSLDNNYPNHIYASPWIYIISWYINTRRNEVSFYSMNYWDDSTLVWRWYTTSEWEIYFTTSYVIERWWYLTLWINPPNTSNNAICSVRLVKL